MGRHKIYCNIHQNVVSDIFVVPGRFFALTDEKGNFIIKNVPRVSIGSAFGTYLKESIQRIFK